LFIEEEEAAVAGIDGGSFVVELNSKPSNKSWGAEEFLDETVVVGWAFLGGETLEKRKSSSIKLFEVFVTVGDFVEEETLLFGDSNTLKSKSSFVVVGLDCMFAVDKNSSIVDVKFNWWRNNTSCACSVVICGNNPF